MSNSEPEINTCIIPTCKKPLGHDSKESGWYVCLEHRLCPVCEKELTPADVRLAYKESVEKDESIELAHARCSFRRHNANEDPTLSIKQSHYDWLNQVRLMITPDMELSINTNENNAFLHHARFIKDMNFDQIYAHLMMMEACVAQARLAIDRKASKERAIEREKEGEKKAKKEARTSSRPVNVPADDPVEEGIALFMENFGFKSRKLAIQKQRDRDKAAEQLHKALKLPLTIAKQQADKLLKESIVSGQTKLED